MGLTRFESIQENLHLYSEKLPSITIENVILSALCVTQSGMFIARCVQGDLYSTFQLSCYGASIFIISNKYYDHQLSPILDKATAPVTMAVITKAKHAIDSSIRLFGSWSYNDNFAESLKPDKVNNLEPGNDNSVRRQRLY